MKIHKLKKNGPQQAPITIEREEDPKASHFVQLSADGKPELTRKGKEAGWVLGPASKGE